MSPRFGRLQTACPAHERAGQFRGCFLSSEVECRPPGRLVITPLIKAGRPEGAPHRVQPAFVRRHPATRRPGVASCYPAPRPAATLPPTTPAHRPGPARATYSGAGDPASPWSSSRLPAASAPPSARHPVRGATPPRPQTCPCATPPPEIHPPSRAARKEVSSPGWPRVSLCDSRPVFGGMGRGLGGRGGALQVDSEIGAGGVAREKGGFPFRRHIQAFSPHPSPAHTRAHTRARWKKPLVGKSQRGRPATPLRRRYKCTLTRPSPAPVLRQRQPRPNNFCIRASAGRLSAAPGRGSLHGHRSPLKPKPGWQSCSSAPPRSPAGLSPPALPRLGAASRSGDSGGRGPPPRSGWRWVGVRAEGCSPLLRPRAAPAAAGAVSAGLGRPPAAGGAARSRPGDAGRGRGPPAPPASPAPAEREVAANKCKLFGPPGRRGENPRSGAGLPPARVGFAAARRGSGASPPRGAGRLAGRFTAPLHSAPS